MVAERSSENIHTMIYQRLFDVVPELLTIEESGTSEKAGLMLLRFEVIRRTPEKLVIRLRHSCEESGDDVICNPDMTIAVYPSRGMAEALTYKDAYIFNAVYTPNQNQIDVLLKDVLNDYLNTWLGNLIKQGQSIKAQIGYE